VLSATVDGTIEVPQSVQPTINTGFVDYKGNWQGAKSSDEQFFGITTHLAVGNGGETLSPATSTVTHIDMTGFRDIFIAVKPSNGGNYAVTAVMGPNTTSYANLNPINPASTLIGAPPSNDDNATLYSDAAQSFTADVWNIITIQERLRNQKLLQFKITNNSGGSSDIEVAFMRLV
jgi:hypothetical protein